MKRWKTTGAVLVALGFMAPALAQDAEEPVPDSVPAVPVDQFWVDLQGDLNPEVQLQLSSTLSSLETQTVTYLGVSVVAMPAGMSGALGVPEGAGLLVSYVQPESPAADAGLQRGDVLVRLNDQLLVNQEQLSVLVRMHEVGDSVAVAFIRELEEQTVNAELQAYETVLEVMPNPVLMDPMTCGCLGSGLPSRFDASEFVLTPAHRAENGRHPLVLTPALALTHENMRFVTPYLSLEGVSGQTLAISMDAEGFATVSQLDEHGNTVVVYEGQLPVPEEVVLEPHVREIVDHLNIGFLTDPFAE